MTHDQRITTLIGIVGTLLTAAGLVTSYFQYHAADLQAQAAIATLMPQVQVRALLEKVDSDKYTDQILEITSDGGPVYNFSADRVSWFEARLGKQVVYERWLTGYYFANYPTGQIKGDLQVTRGHRNNEKYIAFAQGIEKAVGDGLEISRPRTLLRVSYTDALKKPGVDYFIVDGGTTMRLTGDAGETMWRERKGKFEGTQPFDIDSATRSDDLAALVARIKQQTGLVAR